MASSNLQADSQWYQAAAARQIHAEQLQRVELLMVAPPCSVL